jgi:hypothetical protein
LKQYFNTPPHSRARPECRIGAAFYDDETSRATPGRGFQAAVPGASMCFFLL